MNLINFSLWLLKVFFVCLKILSHTANNTQIRLFYMCPYVHIYIYIFVYVYVYAFFCHLHCSIKYINQKHTKEAIKINEVGDNRAQRGVWATVTMAFTCLVMYICRQYIVDVNACTNICMYACQQRELSRLIILTILLGDVTSVFQYVLKVVCLRLVTSS